MGADLGAYESNYMAPNSATTLYLLPAGSDGNPCTVAQPCASLQHAGALASPGWTIQFQNGVYSATQILESVNGTVTTPITIQAQTTGLITITRPYPASDAIQSTSLLNIHNSSYITEVGLTLLGMKGRS